jgi:hypothetical protein
MSKGEKKAFACQENKHWSKRNIVCSMALPFTLFFFFFFAVL